MLNSLLLSLLFIIVFFLGSSPASANKPLETCTPETNYELCYEHRYVSGSNFIGIKENLASTRSRNELKSCSLGTCAVRNYDVYFQCSGFENFSIKFGTRKIRAYGAEMAPFALWSTCTDSGCGGELLEAKDDQFSLSDSKTIATAPKQGIPEYRVACWYKGQEIGGSNWWVINEVGYFARPDVYVVNCVDNSDCASGKVCDKSGNWDSWQCTVPPFNFSLSNDGDKTVTPGSSVTSTITATNTATGSTPKDVSFSLTLLFILETANASWTARFGHTSVVFNDKIWVMGGHDGQRRNDIWSSADGKTWTQETANASWSGRYYHTSVVFNNKIWVMGGYDIQRRNDVWSSADGKTWTKETDAAPWSARYGTTAVVFNDKMWVMGGYDGNYKNDVWSSADGKNWTKEAASASWLGRLGHTSLVFNNKMWVMGGFTGFSLQNDIWSSTDGRIWTQETANASWSGRGGHTSVVLNNKMWVMGGSLKNDVWSSTDGKTWTQETANAGWPGRHSHTSVVFNNKMWVMGGYGDFEKRKNDVWSYAPSPPTLSFSFSPTSCTPNPTCTTTLTISATASSESHSGTIGVAGADGTNTNSTSFLLTIGTASPPPGPPPPPPAGPQGSGSCGTGVARATELVSTPDLASGSKFPTSGKCVIDPKAAFVPFKIPSFDELQSLYYTQK